VVPEARWRRAAQQAREADLVVDVKKIPELMELSYSPAKGLRLGASVPCYRIYDDPQVSAAYPALADGLFYARDLNQLVCLDLRPVKESSGLPSIHGARCSNMAATVGSLRQSGERTCR
jgi:hypothetical protein